MPLHIYNSLTRTKVPFEPIKPPQVAMYVCGPTVYDEPHIGHARSAYIFDVVRKYLAYKGYKVTFARNVTDVDDKIIDKARTEYKGEDLNTSFQKVAAKYLASYHQALQSLGIATGEPEIIEPRASQYIGKMIGFIQGLIAGGAAYQAAGDVYFDITKALDYGKLSNQSLRKLEAGARVSPTENKKSPLDFALWKSAKPEEPSWESPWGRGRPGWHIECSVMSQDILGEEFDIHGGGLDLIFPHHENEIAQSEAAGNGFARIWMHHGLLTINAQKMSKSLGNFVTIQDFIGKYGDCDLLKLFFLGTHYAHPVDYNEAKIEEMRKQKNIFEVFFDRVNTWGLVGEKKAAAFSDSDRSRVDALCARFEAAMDDDFNTPQALASLFELTDAGSQFISSDKKEAFKYIQSKLAVFWGIFGISIPPLRIPDDQMRKIREMVDARKRKDFATADRLREELKSEGYIVTTTPTNLTVTALRDKPRG